MSDRDGRFRTVNDEEDRSPDGRERERREPQRIVHEQKKYSPTWTLISVLFVAVTIWAIGRWLRDIDQAENFATVLVVAVGFTAKYWAKKRPDKLRRRLGMFGGVGVALLEALDNLEQRAYRQPLAVGAAIAVLYGCAIVAAKEIVVLALSGLFTWALLVALAAGVAAVVARPQLYTALKDKLSLDDDDESEDDGPRAGRVKAGENPDEPDRDGDPPGNLGMGEES